MRVLHFYKTYYPESMGGVEQVIHQIAQACIPYGIQTDILTLSHQSTQQSFQWQKEHIHQVQCQLDMASTRFSLQAFRRFKQLAEEVDLIHFHYPWPFMDIVHFITQVKKPTLVTYHSDIIKQKYLFKLYKPLATRFLQDMHHIVATSPQYLDSSPMLKPVKDKTSMIPIGIQSLSKPPSTQLLTHWRQLVGERFFLFVGVLRYYKGLSFLLEALKKTDYPMVIAGAGPMETSLKMQAQQLGLKNIHFIGKIADEDKFALLKLCTAFVFPSHLRSEAFGVSLLEAAMMGKPLISCDIKTGTSYINQHGKTGWEVPAQDPIALAQAMTHCWENINEAETRGEAAKHRYETLFTAEKMGARYAELYQQLKVSM